MPCHWLALPPVVDSRGRWLVWVSRHVGAGGIGICRGRTTRRSAAVRSDPARRGQQERGAESRAARVARPQSARAVQEGNLTIRLLADPTRPFDVSWQSIRKVLLFEDYLLQEAAAAHGRWQIRRGVRLLRAAAPRVSRRCRGSTTRRTTTCAATRSQLQQSGQYDRALAVLTSLYERQPNAPGLVAAVDAVCGKMIEQQLREKNYAAARGVLDLWRQEFQHAQIADGRGLGAAIRHGGRASGEGSAGNSSRPSSMSPPAKRWAGRATSGRRTTTADALLAELQRENPTVSVGVFEASPRVPVRRIDDWATLRASRLVEPTITEIIGFGSEGGVYRSPYGEWVPDESGLRLSLKLEVAGWAAMSTCSVRRRHRPFPAQHGRPDAARISSPSLPRCWPVCRSKAPSGCISIGNGPMFGRKRLLQAAADEASRLPTTARDLGVAVTPRRHGSRPTPDPDSNMYQRRADDGRPAAVAADDRRADDAGRPDGDRGTGERRNRRARSCAAVAARAVASSAGHSRRELRPADGPRAAC